MPETILQQYAHQIFHEVRALGSGAYTVGISGVSGGGKSTIASWLHYYLRDAGFDAHVIHCDVYAHRTPAVNDQYRQELFNTGGAERLKSFLGSGFEIEFEALDTIARSFKSGQERLVLRSPAGRGSFAEYCHIFTSEPRVLIFDGTWSTNIVPVDYRIKINLTYEQTRKFREQRARDPINEFNEFVLSIEQELLDENTAPVDFLITDSTAIACHRPGQLTYQTDNTEQ